MKKKLKKELLMKIYNKALKECKEFDSKPRLKKIGYNLYKLTSLDESGYLYTDTFQIVNGKKKHIQTKHQSGDFW